MTSQCRRPILTWSFCAFHGWTEWCAWGIEFLVDKCIRCSSAFVTSCWSVFVIRKRKLKEHLPNSPARRIMTQWTRKFTWVQANSETWHKWKVFVWGWWFFSKEVLSRLALGIVDSCRTSKIYVYILQVRKHVFIVVYAHVHIWGKWRKMELKFNCKSNYVPVIERYWIQSSQGKWLSGFLLPNLCAWKFRKFAPNLCLTENWIISLFASLFVGIMKLYAVLLYPNISQSYCQLLP